MAKRKSTRKSARTPKKAVPLSDSSTSLASESTEESSSFSVTPDTSEASHSPKPRAKCKPKRKNTKKQQCEPDDLDSDMLSSELPESFVRNGFNCERHGDKIPDAKPVDYTIRAIYSAFPKNSIKLMVVHLAITLFLYLLIFPVVNFIWTYCTDVEQEVATLFQFMLEEPTNTYSLGKHFNTFKWLKLPPMTAETISLLTATSIKDIVVLNWNQIGSYVTGCPVEEPPYFSPEYK